MIENGFGWIFLAFSMGVWFLIFSLLILSMNYGNAENKEKARTAAIPLLVIAWLSTVGVLLLDWLRSFF